MIAAAAVVGVGILLLPRGETRDHLPQAGFELETSPSAPSPPAASLAPQSGPLLGSPAPLDAASSEAPALQGVRSGAGQALYTIYLYKLPGLAPDAMPGSILDIWVTWKPPLTERPKVQLLLAGVQLSRIETGFEQGPVADLLVDEDDVPDLIYGERFGSFNAVTRPK